jgi:peptidoglycan L-alanyl-D-glutamate endopeptidase CwlK
MPTLSKSSLEKLATCDKRLQRIVTEMAKTLPLIVICGHRSEAEQNEAYRTGHSKLKFPLSKHNQLPSKAIDIALLPLDWNDKSRFMYLAGYMLATAKSMGINLRCGVDFNGDFNFKNDSFFDGPHIEIVE